MILVAAPAAGANDGARCLDLVQSEQFAAARSVCGQLDVSDPAAAEVFAYYQQYGVVGRDRLQAIALRGIEYATPEEKEILESSREHLRFAAEAGMPGAPMLLAKTIGLFEHPEMDADTGIVTYSREETHWLKTAAEAGWPQANYQLGVRALSLSGTILVRPEYLPYLVRAAELDHADAVALLAKYEAARDLGTADAIDDPEALRTRAIELWSHPSGDVREANRLMRMLADAGDEDAMTVAGKWAWPGEPDTARMYLEKAAGAGSSYAMLALGNWYACAGNDVAAGEWFRKALANQHPEARYALDELAEWGIDEWDCRYL